MPAVKAPASEQTVIRRHPRRRSLAATVPDVACRSGRDHDDAGRLRRPRPEQAEGPGARRRVGAGRGRGDGLLGRVDVGHHNAVGAEVQRPADVGEGRRPRPHERIRPAGRDGGEHAGQVGFAGPAVLQVHDHVVDARSDDDLSGNGTRDGRPDAVQRLGTAQSISKADRRSHPRSVAESGQPASSRATTAPARRKAALSTSRWVTSRTRRAPTTDSSTPSARAAAASVAAPYAEEVRSSGTMLVSTAAGSTTLGAASAITSASIRARAWSSASRSTWWRSAYNPAAARMPAWRMPPPSRRRSTRASATAAALATTTEPTGAPSPLDRHTDRVSNSSPYAESCTPLATLAFQIRAPSQCSAIPCPAVYPLGTLVALRELT